MCIYHILLIHLLNTSVASMFLLLWIVLLWILVYQYLFVILLSVLLGLYSEVELLDHMVILYFFHFWGITILFSTAEIPFEIPLNNAQRFQFIHILPKIVCCFFHSSYSVGCEMVLCGLDLHFSNDWIIKKAREFQKNIYLCFIDYAKAFDSVDHNKLWKILKEVGIPQTTWLASWETCMQVRKQQLKLDMVFNNRLVPNRKRSTSRLYIVTQLI